MKKQLNWTLISVLTLTSTLSAPALLSCAQAATDDPSSPLSSNLINLTYYPHVGNLYLVPQFESTFHETTGINQDSYNNMTFFVSYGLLIEGLRVSVTESDNLSAANNTIPNTTNYTGSRSGLSDPTIALNYRVIDSTPTGFSADAEISFSPSLGNAYDPQIGMAGSNAKGYGNLGISAALFWSTPKNEIKLNGGITRNFSGNGFTQDTNSDTYTRDSQWVEAAYITDRLHITPSWYVDGEGEFQFGNSTLYSYSNGYSSNYGVNFHVEPLLETGYLLSKQTVLAVYVRYAEYTDLDSAASSTQVRNTAWGFVSRFEF